MIPNPRETAERMDREASESYVHCLGRKVLIFDILALGNTVSTVSSASWLTPWSQYHSTHHKLNQELELSEA